MRAGRWILYAIGVIVCMQTSAWAGETAYPAADSLVSLRRNALVRIGGTLRTDYTYRSASASALTPMDSGRSAREGDLSVRAATLRLDARVHPAVRAFFTLDISGESDPGYDDDILAEAMMVMDVLAIPGVELFAGKGRAPYGQDITLGLVQSYAHAANRIDSPEGRVFIIDPPVDAREHGDPNGKALAPMRPGQFDRTFQAGVAYGWDERWRVEVAAFQPESAVYAARLREDRERSGGSDIGFAGRLWLRPVEDMTMQASAIAAHSSRMADKANRVDIRPDAAMRSNAYAVSLGMDWRPGPWRVFGEWQHAWDWNFTDGYRVDTWQLGAAREFGDGWRLGAVGERLRIADSAGVKRVDTFYTLRLSVRYDFANGAFITGEYGREWFRREMGDYPTDRSTGSLVGVRVASIFNKTVSRGSGGSSVDD